MFATAARFLLSAIVLLLAITLTPFIYQEPAEVVAPVWSLRVMQTPDEVEIGERVTVEIVMSRNGLPGQVSDAHPVLTVYTDAGMPQDDANPLLVVSEAVRGENTVREQRWIAEYTAVRPGAVQIYASIVGKSIDELGVETMIEATGVSDVIAMHVPQGASSGPNWLLSLYLAAIVGLCGLSYYLYRRQYASPQL